MPTRSLLVLSSLLAALPAAAEPLSTDRPTTTYSARVVPEGTVQVESGYTFALVDIETATATKQTVAVAVRGGIAESLELRLDLVPWTRDEFSFLGMGGTESRLFPVLSPGLKYGFSQGGFSAALIGSLVITPGADETLAGGQGAVAVSQQVGPASLFGGALTAVGRGGLAFVGSAGVSVPVGALSPFAEVRVETDGEDALLSSTVGFVVAATDTVQVDVSAAFGPDLGELDVYTFGAGVSVRLPE